MPISSFSLELEIFGIVELNDEKLVFSTFFNSYFRTEMAFLSLEFIFC